MSKNSRKAKIYAEDTIATTSFESTETTVGVVTRTWHDIEQPLDAETLEIGQFEVNWLDDLGIYGEPKLAGVGTMILHEDNTNDYTLIDRSFGLGDAVKLDSSSAMSGIVQGGSTRLTLRNLATREVIERTGAEVSVPAEQYQIGDFVICDDWVGIIGDTETKSLVRVLTGELAIIDDFELHPVQYSEGDILYPDLVPSTTLVDISRRGLKHAAYLAGKYNKDIARTGVICTSIITSVYVDWQFQNMMVKQFVAKPAPRREFNLREERLAHESGTLGMNLPPLMSYPMFDSTYSHQVGDTVKLKGEPDYSAKLREYANVKSESELKKLCREWVVISTKQRMVVTWQNGSTLEHDAVELVPYQNVDDLDLWPSDHVVSKSTGKPGVVQKCDAKERTAIVRWHDGEEEEESLYNLMNDGTFNIDLGDLVLVMPEEGMNQQTIDSSNWGPSDIVKEISATCTRYLSAGLSSLATQTPALSSKSDTTQIDWFGQVVRIHNNGMCTVILGFNDLWTAGNLAKVHVPLTRLVHVASSSEDLAAGSESDEDSDLEVDSTDSESDNYSEMSDDEESIAVPWTDENGQVIPSEDVEEWEDEQESDDTSMDEDTIDVVAEEVTAPDVTDIVLDVNTNVAPTARADLAYDNLKAAAKARAEDPEVPLVAPSQDSERTPAHHRSSEVAQAARPIRLEPDSFPVSDDNFMAFKVLEFEPKEHTFWNETLNRRSAAMKRISQEYKSLGSSLPSGILVRTYESRMDLLRVLILGPSGTPYEHAPMLFDLYIPPEYPEEPPIVHFHSWTNGIGKINPNLYEEGKVCLSLLGTWHGNSESEIWTSGSSLLQIFVSLQALVLVKEPYYNEAGYDVLSVQDTAVASANYSERAYILTRGFVSHVLQNSVEGLDEELRWLYLGGPGLLQVVIDRAEAIISESRTERKSDDHSKEMFQLSRGALLLLEKTVAKLRQCVNPHQ